MASADSIYRLIERLQTSHKNDRQLQAELRRLQGLVEQAVSKVAQSSYVPIYQFHDGEVVHLPACDDYDQAVMEALAFAVDVRTGFVGRSKEPYATEEEWTDYAMAYNSVHAEQVGDYQDYLQRHWGSQLEDPSCTPLPLVHGIWNYHDKIHILCSDSDGSALRTPTDIQWISAAYSLEAARRISPGQRQWLESIEPSRSILYYVGYFMTDGDWQYATRGGFSFDMALAQLLHAAVQFQGEVQHVGLIAASRAHEVQLVYLHRKQWIEMAHRLKARGYLDASQVLRATAIAMRTPMLKES